MHKKIIFINTQNGNDLPNDFFENLAARGNKIELLTNNRSVLDFFTTNNWQAKKIIKLISPEKNLLFSFLYLIISPFIFLYYFIYFSVLKYQNKIDIMICLGYYEKIVFTIIAKLLKIKFFWIEFPGTNYKSFSRFYLFLFRLSSRWTKIIFFNSYTGNKLEKLGIFPDNLSLIIPGISRNHNPHQQNIFSQIASSEQKIKNRKFFVIGTSIDLNSKQLLEAVFWAIKKCTNIIPNIQLIIYGDGKERKNLSWMAKKMDIANLVWFVGEQGSLKKWLDGFDVYVVSSEILKLTDMFTTIQAASFGLSIIGPDDIGLDDIVKNDTNGILTDFHSANQLAQTIIDLEHNRNLRKQLGANSQALVDKNFTIDRMMENLETLFA
jgi:glycosyltransferase involved in cell wall biosynthesis